MLHAEPAPQPCSQPQFLLQNLDGELSAIIGSFHIRAVILVERRALEGKHGTRWTKQMAHLKLIVYSICTGRVIEVLARFQQPRRPN